MEHSRGDVSCAWYICSGTADEGVLLQKVWIMNASFCKDTDLSLAHKKAAEHLYRACLETFKNSCPGNKVSNIVVNSM